MTLPSRSRPKGIWDRLPTSSDVDRKAEVTWAQIDAEIQKILADPDARRHTFSGGPVGETVRETVEILPHGARRITAHWPDWAERI